MHERSDYLNWLRKSTFIIIWLQYAQLFAFALMLMKIVTFSCLKNSKTIKNDSFFHITQISLDFFS